MRCRVPREKGGGGEGEDSRGKVTDILGVSNLAF